MERKQGPDGELLYTILEDVADAKRVDTLDLPPLGESIDVDALVALVSGPQDAVVTFVYAGYDVTVGGDGGIVLADRKGESGSLASDRSEEYRT